MADNNKLELVVEVDVNKANASIKSINTGLSSMEQAAGKAARESLNVVYVWEQESQWQDKIDDQGRSAAIAAVDQRKNLQLAQLESVDARTPQNKVALENAKTAFEVQAMKDRTKIELEEIDVAQIKAATKSNANRRELTSLQLNPGTLTS